MVYMSKFYRVHNGITKNSWMVDEAELSKIEGKKSHFISTSYYSQEQAEEFKKTRSVAGWTNVKTNQIWFDFDSTDVDLSRKDAVTLIERLQKDFDADSIKCWFSGSKGIHVLVYTDTDLIPYQVKQIADGYGADLDTLDFKIYDHARILRAPNTTHEKTGLYKVPVTFEELKTLSITQIKTLATQPRQLVENKLVRNPLPTKLLIQEVKKEAKKEVVVLDQKDPLRIKDIDFTQKPYGFRDYKWSLAQGRFEIGKRNHALMVIASTCRALKYGKDHTEAFCLAADKLHCELTGDTEVTDKALHSEILNVIFGNSWNGGQYSVENDIELRRYCEKYGFKIEKDETDALIGLTDINDSFKDFVVNIDKNTITTGIRLLDEAMPITIGNNLGIIGAASSGKTAMALEILKHTSMNGVVSVIASLDMHRNRLYEKILYKVSHEAYGKSLTREELYKKFQTGDDKVLVAEVKKQFGNVYFYDRSRPTVENLKAFVMNVEAQTGQKVKLLMIDYFERIGSDVSDATASSLKVANELQDLINDLNVALVTLVQPNKFSLNGGPDSPILSYTAIKGSSFLYQSFRSIVSIWRPFFTPKTKHLDEFLEMAILKNDLGELDHFKFNWQGKTGKITEMTEEQQIRYNDYLSEKKQILQPDDDGDESSSGRFGSFRKNHGS